MKCFFQIVVQFLVNSISEQNWYLSQLVNHKNEYPARQNDILKKWTKRNKNKNKWQSQDYNGEKKDLLLWISCTFWSGTYSKNCDSSILDEEKKTAERIMFQSVIFSSNLQLAKQKQLEKMQLLHIKQAPEAKHKCNRSIGGTHILSSYYLCTFWSKRWVPFKTVSCYDTGTLSSNIWEINFRVCILSNAVHQMIMCPNLETDA